MSASAWRRAVPRPVRRALGRLRAEKVRSDVFEALRRLRLSGRPIIAGPWLGEVGFELLYWIPFLRWAESEVGLNQANVVALSRGGPVSWYRDVSIRYLDAFAHVSIEEFRAGNESRRREIGEQKQVRPTMFDDEVLVRARRAYGLEDAVQLHPSLMYRLMQPYWWKHAPISWVERHARFAKTPAPPLPAALGLAPREYVAVKFYVNDCFTSTPETRAFVGETLRTLSAVAPVVSLSARLDIDDHDGVSGDQGPRVRTIGAAARDNLDVQTAVVANARAFVGTYGGFSYLAPFFGVPALGVYADAGGFDRAHLDVAQLAFATIGSQPLMTADLPTASANTVAAFADRHARR